MATSPTSFHLLIADDDPDLRAGLRILLREMFGRIEEAGSSSMVLNSLEQLAPDVLLLDLNFVRGYTDGVEGQNLLRQIHARWPALPVVILTAWAGIDLAVECMKLGATDFVTKPWDNLRLEGTLLAALRSGMMMKAAHEAKERERLVRSQNAAKGLLVCISEAMKTMKSNLDRIALTDATVLLLGENGTGKSLIAEELHTISPRRDAPFVLADMGRIVPTLFEDELFGHTTGAFTDAREARPGLFELASGGTLFLDEVAEIPFQLQPKLLSALGSGLVTRLGSNTPVRTDARVIAATNADLQRCVKSGTFREDLYFRLNTIVLQVPPLRDRALDFPVLFDYFNSLYSERYRRPRLVLTASLLTRLHRYDWPGNVRELSHVVERAVILSDDGKVDFQLLIPGQSDKANGEVVRRLDTAEREAVVRALRHAGGNIVLAAKTLGIGRTTLYRKMEKYGL